MATDLTYAPKVHKADGGDTLIVESGGKLATATATVPAPIMTLRTRVVLADINAGATLLAAIAGYKYRLVSAFAIAYGGAVGALTTLDILGTQATSSVKLVAYAQASLTQSAVLVSGGSGAAVLADGASYAACDAGTAITIGKTGGTATTATGVDVILNYAIEAA